MNNEYERLKKAGYTEEEIKVALDNLNKLVVNSRQSTRGDARSVNVSDTSGETYKTTPIQFGHNKQGIKFDNGEYIHIEDIQEAVLKAVETDEENAVIVYKPTGKVVDCKELLKAIYNTLTVKEFIMISEGTPKILHQDTRHMSVSGEDSSKVYPKGVGMFGRHAVKLPMGLYVSKDELHKAVGDYVLMSAPEEEVVEEVTPVAVEEKESKPKEIENEQRMFVTTKKTKVKPLAILLAGIIAAGATNIDIDMEKITEKDISAGFTIEQMVEEQEKTKGEEYGGLKTGDTVEMEDGVQYYSNPTKKGVYRTGTFGVGERPAGEYVLEYISVVDKSGHKLIDVEYEEGKDIAEFIEKVCKEHNLDPDEVNIWFHIGGPVSGWVRADDIKINEKQEAEVAVEGIEVEEVQTVSDTHIDEYGDVIVIKEDGSPVILNLHDENGNIISNGTVVKGNDGNNYRISDIKTHEEKLTADKVIENIKDGGISFNFHGLDKEAALVGTLSSLGVMVLTADTEKKRKKIEDEKEYEKIKQEFLEDSKHRKVVEKLNGKGIRGIRFENGNIVVESMDLETRGVSR